MADFYTNTYNPDVLSCLANLSNDEVFTPPAIANKMLDLLPQELFTSPDTTFLDPCCKSGVFLREIAKRLLVGLEDRIPDLQQRIDHIFHKQLFGIAITEMTSLLSRRGVYCSKYPNGRYSVSYFDGPEGNIRFKRLRHVWKYERCAYCGASKSEYDRDEALESHAYEFIHTNKPEEIFNMKFDVIIGNPPYQLDTGGSGRQAKPIYQLFVRQAKKLAPRFLSMIIPSRWFSGGMGLDDFREEMLNDRHITFLTDFPNAKDCFPQNSISGGVCYFLRTRDNEDLCIYTSQKDNKSNVMVRDLREFPVMVRYNEAVEIIRKIQKWKENTLNNVTSAISPFALSTSYRGRNKSFRDALLLHSSEGTSYIEPSEITKGTEYLNKYKVLVSQTGAEHAGEPSKDGKFRVLTSSIKAIGPSEVCTHSYILVGSYDNEKEAVNLCDYLKSKTVRFLILQAMTSIHISKATFQFVPIQNFSESWTDEKLYAKYGLTDEEISFIDSIIRPMDVGGDVDE